MTNVLDHLMALARQDRVLTFDMILRYMPRPENDIAALDALFAHCMAERIEVLEEAEPDVFEDEVVLDDNDDLERVLQNEPGLDDPLRLYLREIGRISLLSAPEETQLAEAIERGLKARQRLDSGYFVSEEQRVTLQQWVREGEGAYHHLLRDLPEEVARDIRDVYEGEGAHQHLIQANLRLVVSIAKKYVGRGLSFLDLIQEGNIGLMRATEKFDHHKGYKFSTYATWWIRQAITRSISDQSRTIRLPVHVGETINRVKKTAHRLQQLLEREPTPDEIAQALDLSEEKVRRVLEAARQPVSLEQPVGDDGDSVLGDFIEDERALAPIDTAAQQLMREEIDEVLARCCLDDRERKIIQLRYGLNDGRYRTLEEVGKEFGITRERIRQIESKVLKRLRHPSYGGNKLRSFLE